LKKIDSGFNSAGTKFYENATTTVAGFPNFQMILGKTDSSGTFKSNFLELTQSSGNPFATVSLPDYLVPVSIAVFGTKQWASIGYDYLSSQVALVRGSGKVAKKVDYAGFTGIPFQVVSQNGDWLLTGVTGINGLPGPDIFVVRANNAGTIDSSTFQTVSPSVGVQVLNPNILVVGQQISLSFTEKVLGFGGFGYTYYLRVAKFEDTTSTTSTIARIVSDPIASSSSLEVSVYPNPTSDYFNISMPVTEKAILVEVFDASGRLVLREEREFPVIIGEYLPPGTYILRVSQEGRLLATKKAVKSK